MSLSGVNSGIRLHIHCCVLHRSDFTYTMYFTDQTSHTLHTSQIRFHIHYVLHKSDFTYIIRFIVYFTDQTSHTLSCISQIRLHTHYVPHRSNFTYTIVYFTDKTSHTLSCTSQIRLHTHYVLHRSDFTYTMYFTDRTSQTSQGVSCMYQLKSVHSLSTDLTEEQ